MPSEQEEANLRLVRRVYDEVLGPIDAGPVDDIFTPSYIQHNPNVDTGAEALKAMLVRAKDRYPGAEHRVKRMIASGDLVACHVHVIFTPGERGLAVVDIFRIEDGKVAEHWDVAQPIPETMAHGNGMF